MSLALFTKKKKKGKKKKKVKAFKVLDEPSGKPAKLKTQAIESTADNDADGWLDDVPTTPTYNTLATKIAVVDTRGEKDKPAHENFTKNLEAEKKKMIIHDARRAYANQSEEKNEAPAPKPTKWAPRPLGNKLNIADTKAFPTLGGGPVVNSANVPSQPVENLWNKTEEENEDLIHMTLQAEKKEFVACTKFSRYAPGYFFKNGPEGLGFYKDPHARELFAEEKPAVEPEAGTEAVGVETKEPETVSRFANRKKKKKKKKEKDGDGTSEKSKDKKKKKKKKKDKGSTDASSPKTSADAPATE